MTNWVKKAESVLLNRKIVKVRYMDDEEMKQVGFRQEAARLGGIGSCGRELCCSTWLSDFRSVSTSALRGAAEQAGW